MHAKPVSFVCALFFTHSLVSYQPDSFASALEVWGRGNSGVQANPGLHHKYHVVSLETSGSATEKQHQNPNHPLQDEQEPSQQDREGQRRQSIRAVNKKKTPSRESGPLTSLTHTFSSVQWIPGKTLSRRQITRHQHSHRAPGQSGKLGLQKRGRSKKQKLGRGPEQATKAGKDRGDKDDVQEPGGTVAQGKKKKGARYKMYLLHQPDPNTVMPSTKV